MKINVISQILLVFFLHNSLSAQIPKALNEGDFLPSLTLYNVDNYTDDKINTMDFRGKIVLLDFWSIGCPPCIAALPKLDSLRLEFKDDLKIILVSNISKEKIADYYAFKSQNDVGNEISMLYHRFIAVNKDKLLHQLFPHRTIPHYIWIDKEGKYVKATNSEQVNSENIRNMINKQTLKGVSKSDFLDYNHEKPHMMQVLNKDEKLLGYYSVVIRHMPGIGGGGRTIVVDSILKEVRITKINHTILDFYLDIFSRGRATEGYNSSFFDYGKRIVVQTADSARFFRTKSALGNKEWASLNKFSYESRMPFQDNSSLYGSYQRHIDDFFQISSRLVKQKMPSIVLELVGDSTKFLFNGDAKKIKYLFKKDNKGLDLKGAYMKNLTALLTKENLNKPYLFVDETGISGRVQMRIESPLDDLEALTKELRLKYNIRAKKRNRILDVLVLTDERPVD